VKSMRSHEEIEEWFIRYSNDVHNFLVYYTNQRDVEDLVQEVFIKAMRGMNHFQRMSHPKTWLYTIARNTAIDYMRRHKPIWMFSDTLLKQIISKEKSPSEKLVWQEEQKEIYQLISQLKRSYREVLILRIMEEFSVADTAQILGWSESKVTLTLHRALKAMQKKMLETKGGEQYDLLF
jgi:RNA polymerase sigma-70 factor (ECF subfamily)